MDQSWENCPCLSCPHIRYSYLTVQVSHSPCNLSLDLDVGSVALVPVPAPSSLSWGPTLGLSPLVSLLSGLLCHTLVDHMCLPRFAHLEHSHPSVPLLSLSSHLGSGTSLSHPAFRKGAACSQPLVTRESLCPASLSLFCCSNPSVMVGKSEHYSDPNIAPK